MQPTTNRLRTFTISTLALLTLVLTGMRCNGTKPGVPAEPPKIPVYTQKRVIDRVDWPAFSTINQTALKAMKPEEALKIASSGVPVLVPSDPKLLGAGTVDAEQNGYSFGLQDSVDGVAISIIGGRVSVQSDAPVPDNAYGSDPRAVKIRGSEVVMSGTEEPTLLTAVWSEYGEADYILYLSCDQVTDQRCANFDYMRGVIESLVYIGGNGK